MSEARSRRLGFLAAIAACAIWGTFPLYYHQLSALDSVEVLCHRVVWSVLFCLILLSVSGKLPELVQTVKIRRNLVGLLASGICVSINWGTYIWAVAQGQALDASLAYYMLPLVTLALGVAILGERLTPRQTVAVAIVAAAVVLLTIDRGRLPWIVLVLPVSFGLYGFVRKLVVVDALVGVTVETILVAPLALAYLVTRPQGGALLNGDWDMRALLMFCGPLTTVPLVLFGFGARRMTLTTLGLLQYVNPTLQLVIAVVLLDEHLGRARIVTFLLIWLGLVIYSLPSRSRAVAG